MLKMVEELPPIAFYFNVALGASSGTLDASFQEVSGIESEITTEEYNEPGENRYIRKLPTGVSHPNLVLKRGIAPLSSPLVQWCKIVFDTGLAEPIEPRSILVMLMNESGLPIRTWSFANAYPVKWSIDSLNSTGNEVAIESIELRYNYSNRLA